jgi:DNA-binding MarR family transcriptional regulator
VATALDGAEFDLWVALLRVSALLPQHLEHQLHGSGTNLARYEILAVLARHPDGLRHRELGVYALVSKPRLSAHVAELGDEGLVTRTTDLTDRRASIVRITRAGKRALARWSPGHLSTIRRSVIDQVDPATMPELTDALRRILSALDDSWDPTDT